MGIIMKKAVPHMLAIASFAVGMPAAAFSQAVCTGGNWNGCWGNTSTWQFSTQEPTEQTVTGDDPFAAPAPPQYVANASQENGSRSGKAAYEQGSPQGAPTLELGSRSGTAPYEATSHSGTVGYEPPNKNGTYAYEPPAQTGTVGYSNPPSYVYSGGKWVAS